jgi:bifunctional NMN adenylyltransferase/nudix hydrolase
MLAQAKQFNHVVFIGRFQPFHLAHQQVISTALSLSQYVILVLGSAQDQRSIKNPFTVAERQQMILASFSATDAARIKFVPMADLHDDQKWVTAVQAGVAKLSGPNTRVGLIGHFKDDSSYYLRLFSVWPLIELPNLHNALSATPLREKYFQGQIEKQQLPAAVQQFLQDFQQEAVYAQLCQRFKAQDYSVIADT